MKRIFRLFLFTLILVDCNPVGKTPIKVASFNIRYENGGDASRGNAWEVRCPWICSLLRFEDPDILGCQEVLVDQMSDMKALLPKYDVVGVGRDDGAEAGEFEPIFYRRDRFELLDKGWFWISETPSRPGLGWDAACNRLCTYVHLRDRGSRKTLWMFNLHLDHVGVIARREGSSLVVSRMRELVGKGEAVFLSGDFNVDQTNEIYSIYTASGILEDSFEKAGDRYAPTGSINSFDPNTYSESRIDHIFVSPEVEVEGWGLLTETYRGSITLGSNAFKDANFPEEVSFERSIAKTLSDHFPIFIKAQF